jgi:fructokinase
VGRAAEELTDPAAWEIEAGYLALALVNVICLMSPQRIVVGGGVAKQPVLLPLARRRLCDLLGGYLSASELLQPEKLDGYVVAPRLGATSGVIGAVEMARDAATEA